MFAPTWCSGGNFRVGTAALVGPQCRCYIIHRFSVHRQSSHCERADRRGRRSLRVRQLTTCPCHPELAGPASTAGSFQITFLIIWNRISTSRTALRRCVQSKTKNVGANIVRPHDRQQAKKAPHFFRRAFSNIIQFPYTWQRRLPFWWIPPEPAPPPSRCAGRS